MSADKECCEIKRLFGVLCEQPELPFPRSGERLNAPQKHGVYVIRKHEFALHVGRTLRAQGGLFQRLRNHLDGSSSFTDKYLKGKGTILREAGYTYQYLELIDPRKRALLEAYAIGKLCPEHIGLGQ